MLRRRLRAYCPLNCKTEDFAMSLHKITTVSSVLAVLALGATPALAQVVDLDGTTADVDVNTGALGGSSGGTSATADVNTGAVGGSGGTTADVDVNTGALDGDSDGTSATADLNTGAVGGAGGTTADVDVGTGGLGGDGGATTANVSLGTGGLGGTGGTDADIDIGTGGTGTGVGVGIGTGTDGTGGPGGADVIGGLATLPPSAIRGALANLDDNDVLELKTTCEEVLGSPGAYSVETVAVCEVIASI
jgi:hypothetical protein